MRVRRKRRPGAYPPITWLQLSAVPLSGNLATNEMAERTDKICDSIERESLGGSPGTRRTVRPGVSVLDWTAALARDICVIYLAVLEVKWSEIITSIIVFINS